MVLWFRSLQDVRIFAIFLRTYNCGRGKTLFEAQTTLLREIAPKVISTWLPQLDTPDQAAG